MTYNKPKGKEKRGGGLVQLNATNSNTKYTFSIFTYFLKSGDRIPINWKLEKDTRCNFRKQILQKLLKKYKGTPDLSSLFIRQAQS